MNKQILNQLEVSSFSGKLLNSDYLWELPAVRISHDWYGAELETPLECSVALSQTHLFFISRFSEQVVERVTNHESGTFVEGLWNEDVVELFIKDATTTQYLELNLSPSGAWWGCLFDNYRQVSDANVPTTTGSVTMGNIGNERAVCLQFDRMAISWLTSPTQLSLKISAIRQESPPRYICSGVKHLGQPDFHLLEDFLPANINFLDK